MSNYSQDELDAKMAAFMNKKMHQFPQLKNERYYFERTDSIKPVEKHRITKRSHAFPSQPSFAHAA